MKIIFLGSSHGYPEPNRRCSSILLDVKGKYYFIDIGIQSMEELANRGIHPDEVKACFVTHMHGDHTNGIISYIDLCSWKYTNANTEFYLPGDTERSANAIKEWIACNSTKMRDMKFGHVDDGFVYEDENIKISAFRNLHIGESFSYILEAEGKRVYFSGDLLSPEKMGTPTEDMPVEEFDKGFDLAILEFAHFPAPDKYYELLKGRKNIKTVCLNHYATERMASGFELIKMLPEQKIVFATDGLEFNL